MKVLVVLWTICLIRFCYCGGDDGDLQAQTPPDTTEQASPEPKTSEKPLNPLLSKVDTSLFDALDSVEDHVEVLKLTAKDGTSTNKLTFDGQTVWEAKDPNDSCSVATFYLGPNNDPLAASYRFKRDDKLMEGYRKFADGKWFRVSGVVFKKLIGKDKPTKPVSKFASKVDGSSFDVEEVKEGNIPVLKLTPKDGKFVTQLKYDGKEIWSARTFGPSVSSASLYMDREKPKLAAIKTKDFLGGNESMIYRHYDTNGGVWKSLNKNEFDEKLKTMMGEYATPVTIDLSNLDETKVTVHAQNNGDFEHKFYLPNDGSNVRCIVNAGTTVWEANESDHRCCFARSYSKGGDTLFVITVRNDTGYADKYFEKVGTEWNEVGREVFGKKINAMVGGLPTSTSTLAPKNTLRSTTAQASVSSNPHPSTSLKLLSSESL
ncbi:signal peptide-containing protein [Theileria equi strain WA]|uniref:Signal peptide-containing protein n=1 Tax=Theileria equi strain WA TaxID=1537102 RepID=L0AYW1_THEEQ|nr:signal peptide-containing protein [Theileria equi strain WA]AFZ80755.1 signal peptide-containing protein [Theileria equi strain WA]|eukprot:XP_004830421.1 signal peptide-containing protein [Theileria equi strain WA]